MREDWDVDGADEVDEEFEEYYLDRFDIDHESDFEKIGRNPHKVAEQKAFVSKKEINRQRRLRDARRNTRNI